MPSDEERREAAERLRAMPRGEHGWDALTEAVFGHPCVRDLTARRLADLIEPEERTCVITHIDEEAFYLSCGHESEGTSEPCYCPWCGAKVVGE